MGQFTARNQSVSEITEIPSNKTKWLDHKTQTLLNESQQKTRERMAATHFNSVGM